MTRELNVLALFKGEERFIFVYDDESRDVLIDDIRHKAADPPCQSTGSMPPYSRNGCETTQETPQEEF